MPKILLGLALALPLQAAPHDWLPFASTCAGGYSSLTPPRMPELSASDYQTLTAAFPLTSYEFKKRFDLATTLMGTPRGRFAAQGFENLLVHAQRLELQATRSRESLIELDRVRTALGVPGRESLEHTLVGWERMARKQESVRASRLIAETRGHNPVAAAELGAHHIAYQDPLVGFKFQQSLLGEAMSRGQFDMARSMLANSFWTGRRATPEFAAALQRLERATVEAVQSKISAMVEAPGSVFREFTVQEADRFAALMRDLRTAEDVENLAGPKPGNESLARLLSAKSRLGHRYQQDLETALKSLPANAPHANALGVLKRVGLDIESASSDRAFSWPLHIQNRYLDALTAHYGAYWQAQIAAAAVLNRGGRPRTAGASLVNPTINFYLPLPKMDATFETERRREAILQLQQDVRERLMMETGFDPENLVRFVGAPLG